MVNTHFPEEDDDEVEVKELDFEDRLEIVETDLYDDDEYSVNTRSDQGDTNHRMVHGSQWNYVRSFIRDNTIFGKYMEKI